MKEIVVFLALISATLAVVSYTNHRVVKFRIETEEQLIKAQELGNREGVSCLITNYFNN